MPSTQPLPTVQEMLDATKGRMWGRRQVADMHDGSIRDLHAGIGGLLWIRESVRDRNVFRKIYIDSCEGDDLEWRITKLGGPARIQSTRGAGTANVRRSGTSAGTFWTGTRIAIAGVGIAPSYYRVASDVVIPTGKTFVCLPIEAEVYGAGTAVNSASVNAPRMYWEDAVWDTGWAVENLQCSEGTAREKDSEYTARWRQGKLDRRPGYKQAIIDACEAAGASFVALFEADYAGTNTGINRAFVADAGGTSPLSLLRACCVAVDSARVLSCDMTVWGVANTLCTFNLTVRLWRQPGDLDVAAVDSAIRDGVAHYFSDQNNKYVFRRGAMLGHIMSAAPVVQSVDFGASDTADTSFTALMDSTALPLYYMDRNKIAISLLGPA